MNDELFPILMMAANLPLLIFFVIMAFTRRLPRLSAFLSIAAIFVSLAGALVVLIRHWPAAQTEQLTLQWLASGDMIIPLGFLLDPLSVLMFAVVAVICVLVQVYSLGYMAGDPGFSRYYGFMSLFAWAMMNLALAPNMLQLYIAWELVGLSSYLLIGFWIERFSATEAGKKAFVMTRLGDVAFFLGLLLAFVHLGSLDIVALNDPQSTAGVSPTVLTLSALLIFGGIVGKSAQFPLLTWLPDAMEGPTPVSALLHSATMVAAGVFLFARLFPFFSLSPTAMTVFLIIGTISMLLSSTMALASRDIKQIWAYSTISQLGFMIMGIAAGSCMAGVFHLTTHAGFKALLFLCSGVFIHAIGSNDIFDIAKKGGRGMRIPMWCLVIAAAALSGLPPFSGFFSKEAILAALAELQNPIWVVAGIFGAFLTTYYAFRVIFVIVFPREIAHTGDRHHGAHKWQDRAMAGPLLILAGATLLLGLAHGSFETAFPHGHNSDLHHAWLPYVALGSCLFALVVAWFEFGKRGAAQVGFVERIPALHALFAKRWYMDAFYRRFLDIAVYGVSKLCMFNDNKVIDGAIDGLSDTTVGAGKIVSKWHATMIQTRILAMLAIIAALLLFLLF